MDEIALNPCLNFGKLAVELMLAAGVEDIDGSAREQIFAAVQRDLIDNAHPPGTADMSFRTKPAARLSRPAGVIRLGRFKA